MKTLNEKQLSDRDIKTLLTPRHRPVPPADLAERIKREIPADLPLAPDLDDGDWSRIGRSRVWLMAASVVVAVGGGLLAFRLMEQMTHPPEKGHNCAKPTYASAEHNKAP